MWTNKRLVRLGGIIHHVGLACTFRTPRIPASLPPLQPRRAPVIVETHSPRRFSEWPEDGTSPLKLCRQNPHDQTFIDCWYVLMISRLPPCGPDNSPGSKGRLTERGRVAQSALFCRRRGWCDAGEVLGAVPKYVPQNRTKERRQRWWRGSRRMMVVGDELNR